MNTFLAFIAIFAVTHVPAPKPPARAEIGGMVVRRIKVRSADPYLITQILAGKSDINGQPETSTTWIQR